MAKANIIIPETPKEAFAAVNAIAEELGLSAKQLCIKADVYHTTVYRWANNTRTYDIQTFRKVILKGRALRAAANRSAKQAAK